jgi:hypothetical protein
MITAELKSNLSPFSNVARSHSFRVFSRLPLLFTTAIPPRSRRPLPQWLVAAAATTATCAHCYEQHAIYTITEHASYTKKSSALSYILQQPIRMSWRRDVNPTPPKKPMSSSLPIACHILVAVVYWKSKSDLETGDHINDWLVQYPYRITRKKGFWKRMQDQSTRTPTTAA